MMPRVVLIYPRLGSLDVFIKDLPLSLIYAAADTAKSGFEVRIIDLRLVGDKSWQKLVHREITRDTVLVGLSVMTGSPIKYALMVSKFIKENFSVPVVWGCKCCRRRVKYRCGREGPWYLR